MGGVLLSGRFGCSLQGVAASVVVLMLEAGESCPVGSWWDSAFSPQIGCTANSLHQVSEKFLKYEQVFSEIKAECLENIPFVF